MRLRDTPFPALCGAMSLGTWGVSSETLLPSQVDAQQMADATGTSLENLENEKLISFSATFLCRHSLLHDFTP